jgi:precorrin-6B methylase 2
MPAAYYRDVDGTPGARGGEWDLAERWCDVETVIDLRADDEALDIGCAEGLITLEVARRVRSVRGIEIDHHRVAAAERLRRRLGAMNARFEAGNICDIDLPARSYDVVLFLGVLHHLPGRRRMAVLRTCLDAARRQVVLRTPLEHPLRRAALEMILRTIDECEFDGAAYSAAGRRGGNLVVANRRGVAVAPAANTGLARPAVLLDTAGRRALEAAQEPPPFAAGAERGHALPLRG